METERLMRQEIERLEGLLDAGIKQALKELADEADEAEEGQGALTEEEFEAYTVRRLKGEFDAVDSLVARQVESCNRARLKSPTILASKERLRRRKMARMRARVDARQACSAEEAERLRRLAENAIAPTPEPPCRPMSMYGLSRPIGTR